MTPDVDVLIIGGGPAGSTVATFVARAGLSVAVVEREEFPRFSVGESLMPACMPILERLGVLDRIRAHGFLDKFGVTFHDQESGEEHTFYFREGRPWPPYTYDVHRAEFDAILLDHAARQPGVTLMQPATVEQVTLDDEGVTARIDGGPKRELRAKVLVDASGRDTFLALRGGRRRPMPGLGKVAIYAYYKGARRWEGKAEGNVRIFVFPDGWFWWIPLARDETSVGCVLHARAVRGRQESIAELFESMIERCERVRDGLKNGERVTPIYTAAHFSYCTEPAAGKRFICVGDAFAFMDAIFSPGVFMALQSGELAAAAIVNAFREGFTGRSFAEYARRVEKGMKPICRFIASYYDPSFFELFLHPKKILGMVNAVTGVLAGGPFRGMPLGMRLSLEAFFAFVRINRVLRRMKGLPVESRLAW